MFKESKRAFRDWIEETWITEKYELDNRGDGMGTTLNGKYLSGKILSSPHFTSTRNAIDQERQRIQEERTPTAPSESGWIKEMHELKRMRGL